MCRSLLLTTLMPILCGCFPRDQFWRKPDIGQKHTNLIEAAASTAPVRFVSLYAQPQTVFPATLYSFPSLERLSLRHTGLVVLPNDINKLPKLLWLDLGENQLTELPTTIGDLSALTTLYLSDNRLTTLPAAIGNLPSLRYLNLDRNALAALPPQIAGCRTLVWLRLSENKLTTLPQELQGLSNTLQRLYLRGNPLPTNELQKIRQWLPKTQVIF